MSEDGESGGPEPPTAKFGLNITDKGAREIRLAIEAIVSNDRAALIIFGLAVLAAILLAKENVGVYGLVIMFGLLFFYERFSGRAERRVQAEIELLRLDLARGEKAPQLKLPEVGDEQSPPRRPRRH